MVITKLSVPVEPLSGHAEVGAKWGSDVRSSTAATGDQCERLQQREAEESARSPLLSITKDTPMKDTPVFSGPQASPSSVA